MHRKSFLIQVNNTEILFYTLQIASERLRCGHKLQSSNHFSSEPTKKVCGVALCYVALLVPVLSCCAHWIIIRQMQSLYRDSLTRRSVCGGGGGKMKETEKDG